jgi:hypothetical protein
MLIAVAFALLLAQNTPLPLSAVIPPGTAFRLAWDYPAAETVDGFRLKCDGAILANYSLAQLERSAGSTASLATFTATAPGMPAGKHICHVVAFRGDIDSDPSNTVEPMMAVRSSAPVELRFVIEIRK